MLDAGWIEVHPPRHALGRHQMVVAQKLERPFAIDVQLELALVRINRVLQLFLSGRRRRQERCAEQAGD